MIPCIANTVFICFFAFDCQITNDRLLDFISKKYIHTYIKIFSIKSIKHNLQNVQLKIISLKDRKKLKVFVGQISSKNTS